MKHTKGPWKLDETDDTIFVFGGGLEEDGAIALLEKKYCHGDMLRLVQADANLIAAAPDLYEAVISLLAIIESPVPIPQNEGDKIVYFAKAALKKASGGDK